MQLLAADSLSKSKVEVPYKKQAGDWGALGAVSSPRLVTITEVSDFPCGGAQPGSEDSENQQVEDSKHLGNTACLWFSITALNPPQCLLVRHSPQSYLIERDADAWLRAKASRLWAVFAVSPIHVLLPDEPDIAYHEPLGGPQGKKDGFSAPPAAGAHPRLLSLYVSVCFVNSLLLLLPTHLHALFWFSVSKKLLHSDFDR